MSSIRYPAVEGSFYPSSIEETKEMITEFDKLIENNVVSDKSIKPKALICPHAGLYYSGLTASYAYKLLSNSIKKPKRIIILAPSHRVGFKGTSIGDYDKYIVNDTDILCDKEYISLLKNKFQLNYYDDAHKNEHSAEIQLPLLNYYIGAENYKLITMVYSDENYLKLADIIKFVMEDDEDNLVIISTDLSHFKSYDECSIIDKRVVAGILEKDLQKIITGEACGMLGTLAMVKSIKKMKLKVKLLDCCNSGDISGDKNSVVGYASFVIY